MPAIRGVVCDSYGTLFDTRPLERLATASFGPDDGRRLFERWRDKQLDYAWIRTLTGRYADFWQVSQDALYVSAAELGLPVTAPLVQRFMRTYLGLPVFADVRPFLHYLTEQRLSTAILSQGTPFMLTALVARNGLEPLVDAVVSADDVKAYKPAPGPYAEALNRVGLAPDETLFVTAHGWDLAGAAAAGLRTAWLNRRQQPPDRLGVTPELAVRGLEALLQSIRPGSTA